MECFNIIRISALVILMYNFSVVQNKIPVHFFEGIDTFFYIQKAVGP